MEPNEELNLESLMEEFQNAVPDTSEENLSLTAVFSAIAEEPDDPVPVSAPVAEIIDENPEEIPASDEATMVFQQIADAEEPEEGLLGGDTGVIPVEAVEATLRFQQSAATETTEEETKRIEFPEAKKDDTEPEGKPTIIFSAQHAQEAPKPETTFASRSDRLRELKKKLVSGPEKLYYKLSEQGVLRLQIVMILNLILLGLSAAEVALFTLGKLPESRMRFVIFTQVLAMMVSGLLGTSIMLDGLSELFHLRYSVNSSLAFSFLACCADAWFCLNEERVPCCAGFILAMQMAMLARYHKRSTEMSQLDTMRKAVRLTGIVKEPDYFNNRPGILRTKGEVEDFMEVFSAMSGPEILQRLFAFVALIASIGIAVLTGLLHNTSMAVQIFSTSMLVSVPAGYFITLTRPTAILEKRLHMVGAVICGWRGVKKLCGRAVFPLREKDLFPRGATKLNGIKFYSDRSQETVVSYSASLICAAGGSLVPLFRNLIRSRNGKEYPVVNFQDYGGGAIGGEICGEPVLLGSLEFLQKMGVEIPQGTMVSQAIYVSIDGELAAVIAISYAKMRSAAAGIVSLCGCWKLKTILPIGDFMLTDEFVRSKFSIRTRRLIMPSKEIRAELAGKTPSEDADVLALVTRDDLISSVYTVTGSMALRTACRLGNFFNILAGFVGIAIMTAIAYLGSAELLTPARVLLYELVCLVPTLVISEWTRSV